jgi:GNAT superfamily N-acetyltransferase
MIGSDRISIRRVADEDVDAAAAYVAIRNRATPDSLDSLEQLEWARSAYPGGALLLAEDAEGAAVGTASIGRIYMHGPEFERWWLGIWVVEGARRQGIGDALFRAASDAARAAGKTGFQTELSEHHADGHRFLAARGFVEIDRMKALRLELGGLEPPTVSVPPGIALTTLAARPDLLEGVHRAAVEAFPDVPTGGEPLYAGTLEEFVARDVDRVGVPRDGFVIAVDEATDEVAGYANLLLQPGGTVAFHDMTAVRPAWRGRGIATTLKHATIAWAIGAGLEALETGNDETNAPMRAVNARLGYQPLPDVIGLQGPLAPPA